ncbi:MAG: hypothetical protein IJ368_06820 [Oscillospiraceae bacterium]|nr:hypothetical protein [Oscillospiraceae bacterium]
MKSFLSCCPICGDETETEETDRFGCCLDCFADDICSNVCDSILFDFLRDHGREFREYIDANYY